MYFRISCQKLAPRYDLVATVLQNGVHSFIAEIDMFEKTTLWQTPTGQKLESLKPLPGRVSALSSFTLQLMKWSPWMCILSNYLESSNCVRIRFHLCTMVTLNLEETVLPLCRNYQRNQFEEFITSEELHQVGVVGGKWSFFFPFRSVVLRLVNIGS